MTKAQERPRIAVLGNPNTGKSTLFNALTGSRRKVGNYPGVSVDQEIGTLQLGDASVELIDLPGTYSLAASSPDEAVAVDLLTGRYESVPDAVLLVVDATNLKRNLFLASQVLELELPTVIALNMSDLADERGIVIDAEALAKALDAEVVTTVGRNADGVSSLRDALKTALDGPKRIERPAAFPELRAAAQLLAAEAGVGRVVAERALLDIDGEAEHRLCQRLDITEIEHLRTELAGALPLGALDAQRRYAKLGSVIDGCQQEAGRGPSDRLDRVIAHPVFGSLIFLGIMALIFQSVFTLAVPMMELIDGGISSVGTAVAQAMPPGAIRSLVVDGIIAGVGSVVIFLPQIIILFAFIVLLEDTGYMARAAFLMDRTMRWCGLSGASFIPMLSSFACAVPGIMATRVIGNPRDRLVTILVAPFMTCSARLPIYALLIGAFVPVATFGPFGLLNLQGVVLLALYLLGVAAGVITAWLLRRTALRGESQPFLLEMPPFRWPVPTAAAAKILDRGKAFLLRAGTMIFAASIVVWGLAFFPRSPEIAAQYLEQRSQAEAELDGEQLELALAKVYAAERGAYLESSYLGRSGKFVQPLFAPLGWDWRVSCAALASFPAREVVLAVLATTYSLGEESIDAERGGLAATLKAARHPDGTKVFDLPMALGLMVFFALCLQCVSTLAVMRRETSGWTWPAIAWFYMSALAWVGAWLTVVVGRAVS